MISFDSSFEMRFNAWDIEPEGCCNSSISAAVPAVYSVPLRKDLREAKRNSDPKKGH